MASACVNNIGMAPENFLDCPPASFPSYGWPSPRVSFSREFPDEESKIGVSPKPPSQAAEKPADKPQSADPEVSWTDLGDFEFRLEDPVTMLPADELFSDGKLMPLHVSTIRPTVTLTASLPRCRSPETAKCRRRAEISSSDPYLFSPKAPRCSSKWKELLGLKKLYQNSPKQQDSSRATASSSLNSSSNGKSLKNFLHRSSRSSSSASDASLSLPLLKDSDCESVSISSRLSLSSSSSGHEHEDLPRLSLDSDKPSLNPIFLLKGTNLHTNGNANANQNPNPPRVRLVKPRAGPLIDHPSAAAIKIGRSPMRRSTADSCGGAASNVTADSPRMNPSGKVVFQSLERSSSSPSSFNGGPRHKHRGMERSYSANVRVTPVLNVPVCSSLRGSSKSGGVFGFGQLFSTSAPPKRENGSGGGGGSSNGGGSNRGQQSSNSRNRTDRT